MNSSCVVLASTIKKKQLYTLFDEHVIPRVYEMVEFCTQKGKRKSDNGLYRILSLVTSDGTCINRMEPYQGKFRLKIRKREVGQSLE